MQSRDCTGPAQFVNLHVNKCKTFQVYRSFNREEGFFFQKCIKVHQYSKGPDFMEFF